MGVVQREQRADDERLSIPSADEGTFVYVHKLQKVQQIRGAHSLDLTINIHSYFYCENTIYSTSGREKEE